MNLLLNSKRGGSKVLSGRAGGERTNKAAGWAATLPSQESKPQPMHIAPNGWACLGVPA